MKSLEKDLSTPGSLILSTNTSTSPDANPTSPIVKIDACFHLSEFKPSSVKYV